MKFAASLIFLSALLASPVLAEGKEEPTPETGASEKPSKKNDKPSKDKKDDKDKKADEKEGDADEFDIPVPIGQPVKGLKVPHYDEEGNLQFLFEAEVTRKVDETHIEMETLKIDAYGDDGKKFYIEMPDAVFNLETRILTGDKNVLIRREDFEIVGDAGEFHIKSRFAKILGRVKMTIFSTENFDQP